MTKKAVWLAIGGLMLAGCASIPNTPVSTGAQMAPTQNTYRVLGGTPAEVPTEAPAEMPQQPVAPVVPAPCFDCGPSLDGVLAGYDFNVGNGALGYVDVLYRNSPWFLGFGHDYLPCSDCAVPIAPPVAAPVEQPVAQQSTKGKKHGTQSTGSTRY